MVVKMVVGPIANLSKLASSGQASLMTDVWHHMSRSLGGTPIDPCVGRESEPGDPPGPAREPATVCWLLAGRGRCGFGLYGRLPVHRRCHRQRGGGCR